MSGVCFSTRLSSRRGAQTCLFIEEKEEKMTILHIEHPVLDFNRWKEAFDSDPVDRKKSGVRRYRILRPIDDPNFVMIDLEFDTPSQAEALLAAMRVVWGRVEGKIMTDPRSRIADVVETIE